MHVHQICLTYLVGTAPFPLGLPAKAVRSVTFRATQSPIPLDIFDDLLQLVLETLFTTVYPAFAKRYDLSDEADLIRDSPPREAPMLSSLDIPPIDPRFDETLYYPSPTESIPLPKHQTLQHHTSAILAYIHEDSPSIYSEIDRESDTASAWTDDESERDETADEMKRSSNSSTELDFEQSVHSTANRSAAWDRQVPACVVSGSDLAEALPGKRKLADSSALMSRLEQNRINAKYASLSPVSPSLLKSPSVLGKEANLEFRESLRSGASATCTTTHRRGSDASDSRAAPPAGSPVSDKAPAPSPLSPPADTFNVETYYAPVTYPHRAGSKAFPARNDSLNDEDRKSIRRPLSGKEKSWKRSIKTSIKKFFEAI
ncbi:hypothetical protein HDV03_005490 [Kappamyces sp. JEL0829]|nr:hypothetical protein HDV03_005490 [Kappamyces sp. JEL0829]